jgi:hypothetical protein
VTPEQVASRCIRVYRFANHMVPQQFQQQLLGNERLFSANSAEVEMC